MENLQGDFSRGGSIWYVKTFQQQLLTALLNDLKQHEENGIGEEAGREVNETLKDTIKVFTDIKDGNIILYHFYEALEAFRKLYSEWRFSRSRADRIKLQSQLRGKKRTLIGYLTKEVKGLRKLSEEERKERIKLIRQIDRLKINNVISTFTDLAEKYPAFFPHVTATLSKFKTKPWSDYL